MQLQLCRAAKKCPQLIQRYGIYCSYIQALNVSGWDTISLDYKFQIVKLFYRASKDSLPRGGDNSNKAGDPFLESPENVSGPKSHL